MDNKIEELKFVADLARNGGVMEAQNAALQEEIIKLQRELNEQIVKSAEKDEVIAAKDETIASLQLRVAELDAKVQQLSSQQPTMVVNNFFLLSILKTISYINALDNTGRCFAGHFLHHTLSDNTSPLMLAKVDEITQLKGDPNKDLADAIMKSVEKPTTQINAANYNEHVDEQDNHFPQLPPMVPTQELLEDE